MQHTVYIHTNNKQRLGAMVARHAILKHLPKGSPIAVEYINVDELNLFKEFVGTRYRFIDNEVRTYTKDDLQSFTLSRFMPPELMGYEGRAVVIDPDIFALTDISELFEMKLGDAAIAACRKKDAWDTSVMLMNCAKLSHWNMDNILTQLRSQTITYNEIMTLKKEPAKVTELPRIWNNLDTYTPDTKMIHMTGRLTQPWKTGLPIDFTRNKMPKLFGIIPREGIYRLIGKYDTHYQPHPNKEIEGVFFKLAKDALDDGAITETDIQHEIEAGNVRKDLLKKIR